MKLIQAGFLSFCALAAGAGCTQEEPTPTDGAGAVATALDGPPKFLSRDGNGSDQEARAYYASLGANVIPDLYTLDDWLAENVGSRPTKNGFYRNNTELGFWREMKCTQYVGRGIGGCMVRNWNDPGDQAAGKPDLGTVTMNVSPEGLTRFYVFAPGGKLSPFAILDDEGKKFVPRVCIACHNGTYDPSKGSDLAAIFREFEPSILEPLPGRNAPQEWFDLNQSIRSANFSLRTQPEGGAPGTDHARERQVLYVPEIYSSTSPIRARNIRDPFHLPPSWQAQIGEAPTLVAAKKRLWTDLVSPYCMTCHRTNTADWSEYSQFSPLARKVGGAPILKFFLAPEEQHRAGVPFMPQAKLLFQTFQADTSAQEAIDGWVTALNAPACATGTLCTPADLCHQGAIVSCAPESFECAATTPLPDGTACGPEQACFSGRCELSFTLSIPRINEGVYVRNVGVASPEAHVHLAVGGGTLLVGQISVASSCRLAATTRTLSCNTANLTCTDFAAGDSWKVVTGNTLRRTNTQHPELNGVYRRESPVAIPDCL